MIGMFLHSCEAPETVQELLAHIGLSVSTMSTNTMVSKLSKDAKLQMKKLGHTFLVSYTYDNLDIDIKHSVPTVKKPQDTLIHLTTGTMMPLCHGVTLNDLNCANKLWEKSVNNPGVSQKDVPSIKPEKLVAIHPEEPGSEGMVCCDQFNS